MFDTAGRLAHEDATHDVVQDCVDLHAPRTQPGELAEELEGHV